MPWILRTGRQTGLAFQILKSRYGDSRLRRRWRTLLLIAEPDRSAMSPDMYNMDYLQHCDGLVFGIFLILVSWPFARYARYPTDFPDLLERYSSQLSHDCNDCIGYYELQSAWKVSCSHAQSIKSHLEVLQSCYNYYNGQIT